MSCVICISTGGAGTRVGRRFHEILACEHGLDEEVSGRSGNCGSCKGDLKAGVPVFFHEETDTSKYHARAVFADLNDATFSRCSQTGLHLFSPDNFISAAGQRFIGGGSYASSKAGGYESGLANELNERIRHEAECCDVLHGFKIFHSVAGGAGSGLTSLALEHVRDVYPAAMLTTHSLFPPGGDASGDTVLAPYNTLLSVADMQEAVDFTVCYDTRTIVEHSSSPNIPPFSSTFNPKTSNLQPSFAHVDSFERSNTLCASVASDMTCTMKFPPGPTTDLRKFALNLVPFPRIKFLQPSSTLPMSWMDQR